MVVPAKKTSAKPAPVPAKKPAPPAKAVAGKVPVKPPPPAKKKPAPPPQERDDLLDDPEETGTEEAEEEAAADEEATEEEETAEETEEEAVDEAAIEQEEEEATVEDEEAAPSADDDDGPEVTAIESPEETRAKGGAVTKGTYHVICDEAWKGVSSGKAASPMIGLNLLILHGTDPEMIGRSLGKFASQLWLSEKALPLLSIAAQAFGVIKQGETYKANAAFAEKFIGRHAIVKVEREPRQKNGQVVEGAFNNRIAYGGYYHINDPEMADIPTDDNALAEVGIKRKRYAKQAPPTNNAKPAAKPGNKAPAATAGKPAKKPNWDNV